eukprot:11270308-Alexandrium_andersonii.AAC.1
MSASLVGSEMCIRDRALFGNLRPGLPAWCPRPLRCTRSEPELCAPGAVSYTHLTLPTICSV